VSSPLDCHPSIPDNAPVSEATLQARSGYRAVLKNPAFLALWVGQIFSQLGDRIIFVVFVAIITQHFGANDGYTSMLYVAFTIPAILLTAIAGVFVDRWPRRLVLVSTNLIRAVLVALLPLAVKYGGLYGVYFLAFGISAATQFFVPAEAATIPGIVPKPQLLTANSLFTTTMMASVIFGFALGDPLISRFSLQNIHWPLAALFVLASVALCLVKMPAKTPVIRHLSGTAESTTGPITGLKPATSQTVAQALKAFFAEISEGVAYIRSQPMVSLAMGRLAVLFSAIVALCVLFIGFAKAFLYTDPVLAARKFTYIITSSGIGMVVGALLVGRFFQKAPRGWLVEGGLSVIGLGLVLLGGIQYVLPAQYEPLPWLYQTLALTWTARVLLTYCVTGIMGMAAAFVAIPLQAMVHELIPEDKRGKVLGVQFTLLSTASTLPVMLAGWGTQWFGVQSIMWLIGGLLLAIGVKGLVQRNGFKKSAVDAHW
jgi:MFS family permease